MRTVPLGTVAKFIRGVTFKPADVGPSGIGVMRTKNVQSVLDLSDIIRVPGALIKREDQYLQEGDTLISSANSWAAVGKACWVPHLEERLAIGGFVTALRPDPAVVDPRYLYHWVTSTHIQATLRSFSNQTTNIANLNIRRANELGFPAPPLDQQRRIAAILDHADNLRTKRHQVLTHLDALPQAIFHDMFDLDLTSTAPLGDIAEIASGITKGRRVTATTRSVPYLAVANVQSGHLALDNIKTIEATDAEIERYALQAGDLVLTEGGDPDKLGRGTLWRGEITECIHQNHIFRVRLDPEAGLRREFLEAFLASWAARSYFLRSAKQTTGIASINKGQLSALPVPIPPQTTQGEFCRRIAVVNTRRARAAKQEKHLDDLFSSLQYRAFKGEL